MKKILLTFLFIACAFVLRAQVTEPIRDETIKFINSWLEQHVEGRGGELPVSNISLTEAEVKSTIGNSTYNENWPRLEIIFKLHY